MKIRKSTEADIPRMLEIYSHARDFMAAHGNPNQWGPTNWPPEALLHQDIAAGKSHVCVNDRGEVVGTFFYDYGVDIEETYRVIEDGGWRDVKEDGSWDSSVPYGVVHRIAVDGSEKGIGAFCINWAFEQCGHLKIDTHGDNIVMQNLLTKLGFEKRGIIYVIEDNYPRFAYEK